MAAKQQMVNMDGSDDPHYRYTMPAVQIKVEGTTKMIKTILTNISDVAQGVGRPVDYLVTFFGQEMSANSKCDAKTQKSYVTGNMRVEDLQAACFKFINEYVKCRKCKNPETLVTVEGKKKQATIVLKCISCGGDSKLDNTDRFVKYMTLHPPELTKADKAKIAQRSKRDEAAAAAVDEAADGAEKKKKKKKKKKQEEEEEEDDDEDWSMDVSEEAVRARAEAASADKILKAAEAAGVNEAAAQLKSTMLPEVDDDEVDDIDDI